MNALFTTAAFVLAHSVKATPFSITVPAGAIVQFQLVDTDPCLGAAATCLQAQALLKLCGSARTVFELPGGAPTVTTQLALSDSLSGDGPFLCIAARNSLVGSTPVTFDICQDDQYSRWLIVSGTSLGLILSNADQLSCLSAPNKGQGDPVVWGLCTGDIIQEWNTTIVHRLKY